MAGPAPGAPAACEGRGVTEEEEGAAAPPPHGAPPLRLLPAPARGAVGPTRPGIGLQLKPCSGNPFPWRSPPVSCRPGSPPDVMSNAPVPGSTRHLRQRPNMAQHPKQKQPAHPPAP
eukprot:scaffold19457_cov140-Isochrysis_galbana.AAC.6